MKARALQWLAQREHSRIELRRKLLSHVRAQDAAARATEQAAPAQPDVDGADPSDASGVPDAIARVEAVLDWLEAHQYLSHERFAESRVHARASRFGNLRIRQELAQHEVTLSPETTQALKDNELARARSVWERKYSGTPVTAAERARQARFLSSRGFTADVIRQVLREAGRHKTDATEPVSADD